MSSKARLLELNARLAQNLTDKGVEATADETTTALINKVPSVYDKGYEQGKAEGEEFIGVKYSDFTTSGYYLPTVADARSLEKIMVDDNARVSMCQYLFYSENASANNNRSASLRTIYMPDKVTALIFTFCNCLNLTTIIGDLSNVILITEGFRNCQALTELPYMPNLVTLSNNAFRNCTGLTSITFYKVITYWHTGALTGCTNIATINLVDGWNTAVYAQHCEKLTQACLHDMCEKLDDMTGQTPLVFKIGEPNIAKIDDEHIAMLQQKNIDYS